LKDVAFRTGIAVAVGVLLCILVFPLLSLTFHLPLDTLWQRLGQRAVLDALWLSLLTSVSATAVLVVLGLPVAYLLGTQEFRGKRLLEAIVTVPIVLPPTVAGVGLLLAFGRTGLAGRALQVVGITLPFTTLAVVLAQVFVATPFFVSAAAAGFAAVDRRLVETAGTLRSSPVDRFFRVLLPLALPSITAGIVISWARALGEFGATITFAGNMAGRTETVPLAVYTALQTDLDAAVALSALLVILSLVILLVLRLPRWSVAMVSRGSQGERR
jgi:molybdate transport system permease protein